jgi:ATP-dependent DNA ligase
MLAAPTDRLPVGGGWVYEPKWDGFRTIAFCLPDRVHLQSRSGRNLTAYFPDVARLLRRTLPINTVLDGVMWSVKVSAGRMSHRRCGDDVPAVYPARWSTICQMWA